MPISKPEDTMRFSGIDLALAAWDTSRARQTKSDGE